MNKELREMLEAINNKKAEAKNLLAENKIEEAKAAKEEMMELQNKFDIAKDLFEQEKEEVQNKDEEITPKAKNTVKEFANAVRSKFQNAMSEGSNTDGGYTVPQDIQTAINELRESKDALQTLVTVEPVNTLSGSRVFKSRSQQTGFSEVLENGTILEQSTPQYTNLAYQVAKYAGFMKVTNELLADSDAAIQSAIVRWVGDESRVTRNKKILDVLNTKAKTAVANIDDIKDVVNVQLDPAFRNTSVVVTNQTGFNWMDKLKDADGRYLLQDSVSSPTGKQLLGLPIVVVSNKDLADDATDAANVKTPIIIGDLKEAVVVFDREGTQIKASDVASDAYTTDVTLFRAIERFVVKMRDTEAFVYGQVNNA